MLHEQFPVNHPEAWPTELREQLEKNRKSSSIGRIHERRDDVAVAVTKGDHLAAFEMLLPAIPEVVSAFLRSGRRAVAVNDGKLKQLVLMKSIYRARKIRSMLPSACQRHIIR